MPVVSLHRSTMFHLTVISETYAKEIGRFRSNRINYNLAEFHYRKCFACSFR